MKKRLHIFSAKRRASEKDGFISRTAPRTGSTIAHPPSQKQNPTIFFINGTFHGCSTRRRMSRKKKPSHIFSCLLKTSCSRVSNDDVGVSRDTVFQEPRPGAGFKTGDLVKEKLGGITPLNGSTMTLVATLRLRAMSCTHSLLCSEVPSHSRERAKLGVIRWAEVSNLLGQAFLTG